ncbi:MAG: 5'-nucleotidase C-terminal domain-containing protein [Chloroflexota bacterium]
MPDPTVQAMVVDPVQAGLDSLDADVIAVSEVDLDGTRDNVRTQETNEGNLIADALLWQAVQEAADYGVGAPLIAIQNGGGIRNNTVIPAGDITALDTFDMVPFGNFVAIVEDIPREHFKEILENAVACTHRDDTSANPNCGTGRFPQIAGFTFEWSASADGLILDLDGNVVQEGARVKTVVLDDGTVIVENGTVVPGDPITLATNDFSARGGDQSPYRGMPFTIIGATDQQALQTYIEDGLGGVISADQYPSGGEGRIVRLP